MQSEAKARLEKGRASAYGTVSVVPSFASGVAGICFLFSAVVIAHAPLLRLPYYWDEAGYYIPAAYDFLRRGTLIPYSTLSNAHPPLLSLYLAGWWRVFGFSPFVSRLAMCLIASLALAAVYRLARQCTQSRLVAAATTLLTALYPVWFVQSTLAHADMLAAAGTLWGLCLLPAGAPLEEAGESATLSGPGAGPHEQSHETLERLRALLPAVCCFALAALSKEIAIATPLALAGWELWLGFRARLRAASSIRAFTRPCGTGHFRVALALTTPAIPLAAWFAYHRRRTGFTFGNPEYLRYNATSTLSLPRVGLALVHRALHLTAHLNLFVPVLVTLGCLLLPRLPIASGVAKADRTRLLVVVLADWVFFSILGGALLTRYLLPCYPLILLLCVETWRQRLQHWGALVALSAAAFLLGLFVNPPYRFAPEDTLAYRDSILLQQDAVAQLESRYGRPTVLTAWPVSDELTKPELGYVAHALPVVAIDNFSYPQIRVAQSKAAEEAQGQPYTVALLFSTKYDPPGLLLRLEGSLEDRNRLMDERFFAFHQDLPPDTVAGLLGGVVVWREQRRGQWAALLHFDRAQLALLRR